MIKNLKMKEPVAPPITIVHTVMTKVTVDKIKPIFAENKIRQGGIN